MNVVTIIERIDAILVKEFELDPDQVIPSAKLREDLDLDSLDGVDLIVALEDAFQIKIDNKVLMEMTRVADIHAFVRDHFGPGAVT